MRDLVATLLRDIRFGFRILLRSPLITACVVIVLALGVGANAAMFSIVDGLLLHPVSYPEPETLAFVWSHDSQGSLSDASPADFMDWRAQSKTLCDFAVWMPTSFVLTGGDRPRQISGARVSANFFRTLGVTPERGRSFLPDEDGLDRPGAAAHSVVISHRLWQQDLGADPNVLGRTLYVDAIPYTVVGVAPSTFEFWWRQADVWVPVSLNTHDRDFRDLVVIARLKAPRAEAAAEMSTIAGVAANTYPESDKGWTVRVEDFRELLLNRTFRTRLLLLSGAVGLVLLIACANVASLLLARAVARGREIAVRISLGATPAQLVRQLLTESALLSLTGGALGLAMAWTLIYLAPKIVPPDAIPGARIEFSAGVVWFSLAISLLSCLLCGLAPALAVARSDIQTALKDSSRGSTAGRKSQRFRQAMIVAEAAVAVMLLASAGIMIESLRDLTHSNPGFDPKNVVTVRLVLPAATYDAERALRFYRQSAERIATLPGVKSVAESTSLPQVDNQEVRFKEEGAVARSESELPNAPYFGVGPEYFRTLGIPLKQGRFFIESDNENAPLVTIINEALATRYFPNQDPIGKRLTFNRPIRWQNGEETVTALVVGVVGNVRLEESASEQRPEIYVPHSQNPWSRAVWFVARTQTDPAALGSALRTEFMALDKEQPIDQLETLEQRMQNHAAEPTFQTQLMELVRLGGADAGRAGKLRRECLRGSATKK